MASRTSWPSARSAPGSDPATSASPPTLTNGAASAARYKTFTGRDYPLPLPPGEGGGEGASNRNRVTRLRPREPDSQGLDQLPVYESATTPGNVGSAPLA